MRGRYPEEFKIEAMKQVAESGYDTGVLPVCFAKSRSTFSFIPGHRIEGEEVRIFEIRWDKYWKPRFVIGFGKRAVGDRWAHWCRWRVTNKSQRQPNSPTTREFALTDTRLAATF